MPTPKSFNATVASRTRAASYVLSSPALLSRYLELGGLEADLEQIRDHGLTAEAANHGQGAAVSSSRAATLQALGSFHQLEQDYSLLMAVVRAVRGDLVEEAAPATLRRRVDDVLANQAAVTVSLTDGADGGKKRSTSASRAQEPVRAEIERDVSAVLAFSELATRLAARKWDAPRLGKLQADARALSGLLADRVAKKGTAKASTRQELGAVAAQAGRWGAAYGLLSALGRAEATFSSLLRDAAK